MKDAAETSRIGQIAMMKLELYLESDFYALWKMEKEQRQREAMVEMKPKVVVDHSYFG